MAAVQEITVKLTDVLTGTVIKTFNDRGDIEELIKYGVKKYKGKRVLNMIECTINGRKVKVIFTKKNK